MSESYRLVLLDDDTLKEVKSVRLSGSAMLITIAAFTLIFSMLGAAIVVFTPFRQLVPGYGDIENNKSYQMLSAKLDTLEQELEAQQAVTSGFRKMLNPSEDMMKEINPKGKIFENNSKKSSIQDGLSNGLSIDDYYFWSPLNGRVSAAFDSDNKHFGVDIVAEKDSPVLATLSGVVIGADWNVKTGNTISVQHDQDLISVYKHNSSLTKKIGEKVSKGEVIAIIGNSGILTSGPHVHFELWHNGKPIDPEKYIVFKN